MAVVTKDYADANGADGTEGFFTPLEDEIATVKDSLPSLPSSSSVAFGVVAVVVVLFLLLLLLGKVEAL